MTFWKLLLGCIASWYGPTLSPPKIYLDWSGGGSLNADSDHRAKHIAALRAADRNEFEQLIELVRNIARKD